MDFLPQKTADLTFSPSIFVNMDPLLRGVLPQNVLITLFFRDLSKSGPMFRDLPAQNHTSWLGISCK
jgi:hypothetical protein